MIKFKHPLPHAGSTVLPFIVPKDMLQFLFWLHVFNLIAGVECAIYILDTSFFYLRYCFLCAETPWTPMAHSLTDTQCYPRLLYTCWRSLHWRNDSANKIDREKICFIVWTSDKGASRPAILTVFTVRIQWLWIICYLQCVQLKLWLDRVYAQGDLSLWWSHIL